MPKTKQAGFTIVELLIVIVVIAILATIGVVAYAGIQDRAEVSKTATVVKQYKDALTLYKLDEGTYPSTGGFCLGDQYTTFTGGATAGCRYSTSVIANTSGATARDGLKKYLNGQLPMPSTKLINFGTTEFVGAHFYGSSYAFTLDGRPVVVIEYYVRGDTCPVGPVYVMQPSPPANTFLSPAASRSQAFTNGSRCYLPLPND